MKEIEIIIDTTEIKSLKKFFNSICSILNLNPERLYQHEHYEFEDNYGYIISPDETRLSYELHYLYIFGLRDFDFEAECEKLIQLGYDARVVF
jgi:hypothetical protein